jgi:hypothetical protein
MKKTLLILLISFPLFAVADDCFRIPDLYGLVTDAKTGELLPFVNIVIEKDNEMVRGTQTTFEGYYSFSGLEPGLYTLKVSSIGFEPKQLQGIEIIDTEMKELLVKMEQRDMILSNIRVVTYCFRQEEKAPENLIEEQELLNANEDKLLPSADFSTKAGITSFTAYPNPTQGVVTLTHLPDAKMMFLIDMTGKIIRTIYLHEEHTITIDMGFLEKGMYLLKYEEEGQHRIKKLMKN